MLDRKSDEREGIVKRYGDLEVEENLKAQQRMWRAQRVGRAIGLLLLLLALAGVLGGGPLSDGRSTQDGALLEYERIAYRDTPQSYRLILARDDPQPGKARVWLDKETLERMKLEQVVPEPSARLATAQGLVFEFDVAGGGPVELRFNFEVTRAGVFTARLGVEGEAVFEVSQLFLP